MRKISIVTPSFNQGQFIEDAIQSVLNQGYENFEHIIIDACSTDNTINLLKKYPHLIWVSEPDEGQSDAINKGFKMATGDIIGWLNADDMYLSGVFNIVSKTLSNNRVDAIYANYKFVDANGLVTKEIITQQPNKWMSLFYCYIPSTTFFFKRSIIDANIFIDKSFHIAMDKEFFAHIFFKGYKFTKVNEFFAHFRWHDSNKSIDTPEVKNIRLNEGIEILRRYSKIGKLRMFSNKFTYLFVQKIVGFLRTISRTFKFGLYR